MSSDLDKVSSKKSPSIFLCIILLNTIGDLNKSCALINIEFETNVLTKLLSLLKINAFDDTQLTKELFFKKLICFSNRLEKAKSSASNQAIYCP